MAIRYAHTNIIADDWKRLAEFYINVFDCIPVPPERNQSGDWLEKGTGVKNARLRGLHLRLPGHGDHGPMLEIYSYEVMIGKPKNPASNRKGFGHLAFEVENVRSKRDEIFSAGGHKLGEVVVKQVEGVGVITFTYVTDPERNIIELQNWDFKWSCCTNKLNNN